MPTFDANGNSLLSKDALGYPVNALLFNESTRSSLTDGTTSVGVQPVGLTGFGDPVFSDEFQSGSLNTDKWIPWYPDTSFWNVTAPGGHKTNSNEPEGYDETGISFDADGLVLTYRHDNHAVPELAFTSGMISSYPSFSQQYGYFEAMMRLSDIQGSWPAFWMDAADQTWPPELDIMENWGQPSFNNSYNATYHYKDENGAHQSDVTQYGVLGNDFGTKWHAFGALWEPGRIRWYIDGILVKDYQNANVTDKPMYMICNLAGAVDGPPSIADTPFSISVRYIRAWRLP